MFLSDVILAGRVKTANSLSIKGNITSKTMFMEDPRRERSPATIL